MTAIHKAATLNVAKTFHKDKDYGSVEPGKVADLSIIEGNPLQDIWMTQNVKMVVMNGKIVDHQFHKYVNPIPEFNSWQQLSEHIVVTPYAVAAGSGPTTLKIAGRGFWPFHQVLLNGKPLETKFINRTELDAIVPPEAIKDVGDVSGHREEPRRADRGIQLGAVRRRLQAGAGAPAGHGAVARFGSSPAY